LVSLLSVSQRLVACNPQSKIPLGDP